MHAVPPSPWTRHLFRLAVAFSALTGFAQMPIFKRYYIADLPGLEWLAQYYVTHALHYVSAVGVAGVGAYLLVSHMLTPRRFRRAGLMGYLKPVLLLLIVISGGLLVIRNLPGYRFDPQTVAALNFAHLGLVLSFLFTAAATLRLRKRRLRTAS